MTGPTLHHHELFHRSETSLDLSTTYTLGVDRPLVTMLSSRTQGRDLCQSWLPSSPESRSCRPPRSSAACKGAGPRTAPVCHPTDRRSAAPAKGALLAIAVMPIKYDHGLIQRLLQPLASRKWCSLAGHLYPNTACLSTHRQKKRSTCKEIPRKVPVCPRQLSCTTRRQCPCCQGRCMAQHQGRQHMTTLPRPAPAWYLEVNLQLCSVMACPPAARY